ncbi:MAG: sigma 54-interacting transcriptional regulator [Desulfovibrionaceae bacterium]|nr:sigma 54-interacting transcriptional regulator [Desulfovibrionaceae bacterium]
MTMKQEPAREISTVQFEKLLDRLPGMIYRCKIENLQTLNLILEYASLGSDYLLGIPAKEMVSKHWNTIERMMHPQDLERTRQVIRDKIVAHEPYQIIYRVYLPNGELKWLWDQGEAIFDEHGVARYLDGIILDVSEQKFQEYTLQEENRQLKFSLEKTNRLGSLVGKSEAMHKVYSLILKAAETDINVIIYGETGCGKDVVARSIHQYSHRKGNYVPVNCGAIPENLLESEFFGYSKGAFTGATMNKDGFLTAADNGTLFLDEIGELPINLQVKFLRVLETKSFRQLGSNKILNSNFRLIAATNRDMAQLVKEGKVRADFYYRINVLPIIIPPLRERKEDLPLLIDAWCENNNIELRFSSKIKLAMNHYDWPGNVRELHNFLDRYVTFGENVGESLEQESILELPVLEGLSLEQAVSNFEKKIIVHALDKCRWHRGKTSQYLGLNLRTLQRKIKNLGINEDKR